MSFSLFLSRSLRRPVGCLESLCLGAELRRLHGVARGALRQLGTGTSPPGRRGERGGPGHRGAEAGDAAPKSETKTKLKRIKKALKLF